MRRPMRWRRPTAQPASFEDPCLRDVTNEHGPVRVARRTTYRKNRYIYCVTRKQHFPLARCLRCQTMIGVARRVAEPRWKVDGWTTSAQDGKGQNENGNLRASI